jgi:hypothetical protein
MERWNWRNAALLVAIGAVAGGITVSVAETRRPPAEQVSAAAPQSAAPEETSPSNEITDFPQLD